MAADRYLKIVLTVIALELGWMAVKDTAVDVSAQQRASEPMPVTLVGSTTTVRVASERPLQVEAPQPLRVFADRPIVVETGARPLSIQSVPAVGAKLPGE
ncbi:MAG TPA: hypothetical protein VI485_17840 [Vicinamibacterales bacterium]|nr:hypothetical protein [Vicinamibacterales bacterium]